MSEKTIKTTLYRYNPWWEGNFDISHFIVRQSLLNELIEQYATRDVLYLTGIRRIGKTTLMKLLINHLIQNEKIDPTHILYWSADDYQLQNETLLSVIDSYRALHRLSSDQFVTIFIDEITNQKDFEVQLKNLYDAGNCKVIVSSSSASLLKSNQALLTGRHRIIHVSPLNFQEFLQFRNITIQNSDAHLTQSYFEEFLRIGGIPEYVLHEDPVYLQQLVDDILTKDVAQLYQLRRPEILRDLFALCMERSAKQMSLNKIANILDISPDTARRYMEMLSDVHLIHPVNRFGTTNETLLAPKKFYACDLGVRNLFTGFRDLGALFEQYVFLQIQKLNPVYVYEGGYEIDFFVKQKSLLIEAKYGKAELSSGQKKLFTRFVTTEKIVIRNADDIELLF